MKKIALLLIAAAVFSVLASCARTELETPANMKLASVEATDYYMYVPNDWIIASQDGITAAYVSVLDTSNVSCARYALTNEAVFETSAEDEKAEISYAKNYWTDYVAQLGTVLPGFTMLSGPQNALLDGHAAIRCSYSASLSGKTYKYDMVICMIVKSTSAYAYLLTFTAEEAAYDTDVSFFDKIISEFRFQTGQFE